MKQKDVIVIAITIAVLAITGMLVYTHFSSNKGSKGVTTVEVIDPIASSFDKGSLDTLADPSKVLNFRPTIDLSKLGNSAPFGPLH